MNKLLYLCCYCFKVLGCYQNGKKYECKKDGMKCLAINNYCPITDKSVFISSGLCISCYYEVYEAG